jgi:hypothetical protein
LYAEICEVFLGKRQEARGIAQELSPAQKQQVLQSLAYHLMEQGIHEISYEEAQQVIAPHLAQVNAQMSPATFLQLVENTSGLLLERDPGSYGFAHKTFQEYLAAVYIKEQGQEQVLIAQVENDWWHETIRLYCAQADATAIILACLAGDRPSVSVLTLALQCDEEKLKIQPAAKAQLDTLLKTGVEDPDPERRRLIAEALLTRRVQQMAHVRGETYIDTWLITWAEYQLFLDEKRAQGVSYRPDHWMADSFPQGQGQAPALGVRSSDAVAFCQWLTARDPEGWRYRLPKKSEPYQTGVNQDPLPQLTTGIGYWTDDGKAFVWIRNLRPQLEHIRDELRDLLVNDLGLASAYTLGRARDLALAHDLDRASALNRASARASARARDLDRVIANARDLALALANASANASDLDRARARDRTRALANAFALAHNLTETLDHTFVRRDAITSSREQALPTLWSIRYSASVLIHHYSSLQTTTSSSQPLQPLIGRLLGRKPLSSENLLSDLIESWSDLHTALALLELRIRGRLPAWEGILLVKERVTEHQEQVS